MRRTAAVVILTLLALPALGSAAPSLTGPTGLVLIPTASTLGMAQWDVGAAGVWADDDANSSILYANVGLISGLEAGFTREKLESAEAETLLNAKLHLLAPPVGKLKLAAGMIDITDQVDRSPYIVLTHTLGAGILTRVGPVALPQVHVGVGGGRLDGLFAGVSTTVNRRWNLMAEYDGEHFNAGARTPVATNVEATVAVLDGLENVAAGLSFSSPW